MRRMADAVEKSTAAAAAASSIAAAPLQYIVIRSDLKWPKGAIASQAAHVAVACLWEHKELPQVQSYLAPGAIDTMHKCVLGIESLDALMRLKASLDAAGVPSRLWTEQPENVITSLATVPAWKDDVKAHFEGLKLLR